jgi:hypothetical protein
MSKETGKTKEMLQRLNNLFWYAINVVNTSEYFIMLHPEETDAWEGET